jgi:hypothetical protein
MWKRILVASEVAVVCVSAFHAEAQGTFQNLDFEAANIVTIPGQPFQAAVADALPGWTVDFGSAPQTQIPYNSTIDGGQATVEIFANGYPGGPGPVIDGNFDVFLQGGRFNGVPVNASISQTGQIPSGTQSLFFDASFGPVTPLQVFIGDQQIPFFAVGIGGAPRVDYTVYAANISAWAGQTEQLTFSSAGGFNLIDDISFSPQAVPEPSPLALTGVPALIVTLYRRFAPKRSSQLKAIRL